MDIKLFLSAHLKLARVSHYIKNGFVWLPLIFSMRFTDLRLVLQTGLAFLSFCFAASSIYIINDLKDIEADRQHPVKKNRPLAAGLISIKNALFLSTLLIISSFLIGHYFLGPSFLKIIFSYILLNIFYTFYLKNIAIIDVACIALGFVLRVLGGGVASGVQVSHWLIIMTFLLSIFLALAKRRDDLLLAVDPYTGRQSLQGYSLEFVSTSMAFMAGIIVISYILYTVSPDTIQRHGTDKLYITAVWVVIGLLRYLQLTLVYNDSGSPTSLLFKDKFLYTIIIIWFLNFMILIER